MPVRQRVLLLAVAVLAACQSAPGGARDPGKTERPAFDGAPPGGEIVRTSRDVARDAMLADLLEADIVYVGEQHDNALHHRIQLHVIEYLWAGGRLHAIGMEMFQRRFQPALDDYVEGEIDEKEMLERTEYAKRWGFPIELYRPILAFARAKRVPLIALNVEDEVRKAARESGVEGLPADVRATLPAIDTGNADHRAFLHGIYKDHLPEGTPVDEEKFERFYLIMCMWDDVMADTVVRWFGTAPDDGQIVVLAGVGHIANRYGIPGRAHHRIGKTYRTVVPVVGEPARDAHAKTYADYLWITPAPPKDS